MLDVDLVAILTSHHLKVTVKRKKVLDLFYSSDSALSTKKIESQVGVIDRVTLYRILSSFVEAGIIHKVTDSKGSAFYAKCTGCGHQNHEDDHAHFHCKKCASVICLNHIHSEDVRLPKGYQIQSTSLTVYGLCDKCNETS
jgi:Fur family ferric uptake transcriptional regulator